MSLTTGFPTGPRAATVSCRRRSKWKVTDPTRAGSCAAAAFHDANGNGKFDKNLLGWPLEGFGFSNDAHVSFFRPPSFAAASFTLPPEGATQTLHLDYWSKC